MKISDIVGIGEVGCKALDKVASVCSWLAEPYQIKRIAKAEAAAALIKAKADEDILDYSMVRSMVREDSIKKAILKAVTNLQYDEVSSQPLDPNWFIRWSDITGGFTTDQAINLWSKVLASEIKESDSISFRTMETLKNMSSKEGEAFANITNLVLKSESDMFILNFKGEADDIFNYNDLFLSEEAGLLMLNTDIGTNYKNVNTPDTKIIIRYQNKTIEIDFPDGVDNITMPIFVLTTAGKELYPIANRKEINKDYLNLIEHFLKVRGLSYKII